jgi:hypothetical protein
MNRCQLFVGLLLPHPCENAGVGVCAQCSRLVCEAHADASPSGLVCRACASGSRTPLALSGVAAAAAAAGALALFQPADLAAFEQAALRDEPEEPEEMFADLS